MSITFQRAPTVAAGDPLLSRDFNKLAEAFNTRIKSGVGDCAWRIVWYLHSALKLVTLPGGEQWHAVDEFMREYALDKARVTQSNWPEGEPGGDEGANLANPLMRFVFGLDGDLESEDERLTGEPSQGKIQLPTTRDPWELWQTGKLQRGFYDPSTGAVASPSLATAQRHYRIPPNSISKYLVSFGGFAPSPQEVGDCGEVTVAGEIITPPKFDLFFTHLSTGAQTHYTGFCPASSPGAAEQDAIFGIYTGPFAYYVFRWDGGLDRFPYDEYVVGPFSGAGSLQLGANSFLDQALNRFVADFRGSESDQEQSNYDAKSYGFEFQRFLSSQYLLAPSRGVTVGDSIEESTHSVTLTGPSIAAGVKLEGNTASGMVAGGFVVKATGVTGQVVVKVTCGTWTVGVVTVTAEAPVDYVFSTASLSGVFTVTLLDDATASSILVEVLELQAYKPGIHDAYLLLRLASAGSSLTDGYQGDGRTYDEPQSLSFDYLRHGCIVNTDSAGLSRIAYASENSIVESARRLCADNVRVASGDELYNQLVKYAVVGGKSVLWFKRNVRGSSQRDLFDGIGPATVASGDIQDGITYKVTGGSVTYNETLHADGSTFSGVFGVSEFTGSGTVKEADGIKASAPKRGWSNRWVMFFTWAHYRDDEASAWKEGSLAGPWAMLNNPCHVYSPSFQSDPQTRSHFAYGSKPIMWSEAPSGYNFAKGLGIDTARTSQDSLNDAFRGCKIYQAPYEIESAVDDGEFVKVTLTTRLRHHTESNPHITESVEQWDRENLYSQVYETDEARVMKYLLKRGLNIDAGLVYGDAAADGLATLQSTLGPPKAAIIPRAYFVRLIPTAYEDCNDTKQNHDTVITVEPFAQMELYARPMCEGFVDSTTSASGQDCSTGAPSMFDFTFENAMIQANGVSWFWSLPSAVVGDNVKGFGPLPNTKFYASMFNTFSNFVNLLTRARVELPLVLQYRQQITHGLEVQTVYSGTTWGASGAESIVEFGSNASVTGSGWALWEGVAPTTGMDNWLGDWVTVVDDVISLQASKFSTLSDQYAKASGGNYAWAAYGSDTVIEWRMDPGNPALQALSSDLWSLLRDRGGLFVRQDDVIAKSDQWTIAATAADNPSCDGSGWPGDNIKLGDASPPPSAPVCFVSQGGTITAPALETSRAGVQITAGLVACQFGGMSTTRTITTMGPIGQGNVFVDVPVVDVDPCDIPSPLPPESAA